MDNNSRIDINAVIEKLKINDIFMNIAYFSIKTSNNNYWFSVKYYNDLLFFYNDHNPIPFCFKAELLGSYKINNIDFKVYLSDINSLTKDNENYLKESDYSLLKNVQKNIIKLNRKEVKKIDIIMPNITSGLFRYSHIIGVSINNEKVSNIDFSSYGYVNDITDDYTNNQYIKSNKKDFSYFSGSNYGRILYNKEKSLLEFNYNVFSFLKPKKYKEDNGIYNMTIANFNSHIKNKKNILKKDILESVSELSKDINFNEVYEWISKNGSVDFIGVCLINVKGNTVIMINLLSSLIDKTINSGIELSIYKQAFIDNKFGVLYYDPEKKHFKVNNYLFKYLDKSLSTIKDNDILVSPYKLFKREHENLKTFYNEYKKHIKEQGHCDFSFTQMWRIGDDKSVYLNLHVSRFNNNMLITTQDLSKQMENNAELQMHLENLKISEEIGHFGLLYYNVKTKMVTIDENLGKVIRSNHRGFDFTKSEHIDNVSNIFFSNDEYFKFVNQINETIIDNKIVEGQFYMTRGSLVRMRVKFITIYKFGVVTAFVQDIDDTYKKEKEVYDLRTRLEFSVNSANLGTFYYDINDGNIEYRINKIIEKKFNIDPNNLFDILDFKEQINGHLPLLDSLHECKASERERNYYFKKNSIKIVNTKTNAEMYFNMSGFVAKSSGMFRYIICVFEDTTERLMYEQKMEYSANHDFLTGLPNRRMLNQYMKTEEFNIYVLLDVNNFKYINDFYGHDVGDIVLVNVGKSLNKIVKKEIGSGMVFRIGGDEFVIIINEQRRSLKKMISILEQKASKFVFEIEDFTLVVESSVGVVTTDSVPEKEDMYHYADELMYIVKRSGKNEFKSLGGSLLNKLIDEKRISTEINTAIEKGNITPFFQPVFNVEDNEVYSVEVLARCFVDGEYINPTIFVSSQTKNKMLYMIDQLVFKKTMSLIKKNIKSHPCIKKTIFSFNFSYLTLFTMVIDDFINEIEKSGLSLSNVFVEVLLEFVENEEICNKIQMLKKAGINIIVDKFSAGHSSLIQIKKIDVDYVKIDKSLMPTAGQENSFNALLLKEVFIMLNRFDLTPIGEGVEVIEEANFLKSIGFKYIQGFFYSHPVTFQVFIRKYLHKE